MRLFNDIKNRGKKGMLSRDRDQKAAQLIRAIYGQSKDVEFREALKSMYEKIAEMG